MTFIIDTQPIDMVETFDQNTLRMLFDGNDMDCEKFTNNRIKTIRFLPNSDENQVVRYYWTGEEYTRRLVDDDVTFTWIQEKGCYRKDHKEYYVYISVGEDGRLYIGSYTHHSYRSSSFDNDGYYGSFTDRTFKPVKKIKVCECSSRNEAYEKERQLQILLGVDSNPDFANKCIESMIVSS